MDTSFSLQEVAQGEDKCCCSHRLYGEIQVTLSLEANPFEDNVYLNFSDWIGKACGDVLGKDIIEGLKAI